MTGIVVAAKREWEHVVGYYGLRSEDLIEYPFGQYFFKKINDIEVIFYSSGSRKVNSSGANQYMISKFNLNKIIVIGTCAGINESLKVFDVVIPNVAVQYDATVKEMEPLIKESFTVKLKDYDLGFIYKTRVIGTADKALVYWPDYLMLKENKIDIADTESAAVAYICKRNNVECVIIKGISDFPHEINDKETYEKQFNTFMENIPIVMKNILDNYLKYFI
jgi:nucleoside phosphorylase